MIILRNASISRIIFVRIIFRKRKIFVELILVEPQIRLELMTCRLQGGCSTN